MSAVEVPNRPVIAAKERGPGPGRYALPSTVGFNTHDFTKHMNPAHSFGHRLENPMFRKDSSPGPTYFINSSVTRWGRDGTPAYSISGRLRDINSFSTPAPGTYSPEQVHPQGERHAPAYSMGSRTRYRQHDNVPSPSCYSLPHLLGSKVPHKGSSPSYTMTGRSKTGAFSEDLAKTPGPNCYTLITPDLFRRKAPAYSMLGRNEMPGDRTSKPGPGAYSPEKVRLNKQASPTFSMGIRHSEYITPLIIDVTD
ncbi:PREDICTED: outer dense fiber protein 3-like [Priapulus caudatus]|uniref:Outer dense fiber protein 3-like n=1 Tax=Priapulus caudatus TaxID=37621 RepID=A0ABM1DR12_PRICU|nr:PREDICTED: outer dense fiber protein 3-like [Priapulus caudatus]